MLLQKLGGRQLLPAVRIVADPERSMDFEFVFEPISTPREACSSLEAALERANIWAQILHDMLPGNWVNSASLRGMVKLASTLSLCGCLAIIHSNMDIRTASLRSILPAVLGPEWGHLDLFHSQ